MKHNPFSGRMIPEIGNPNCREIIYGSYRIMYRIEKNSVWITSVIHGEDRTCKPGIQYDTIYVFGGHRLF